jgi:roadblock/LC7 domain-containing protein
MKVIVEVVAAVVLLALAAFCLFGFLATYEPTEAPGMNWTFRIGYAVVGISCVVCVVVLILKAVRK